MTAMHARLLQLAVQRCHLQALELRQPLEQQPVKLDGCTREEVHNELGVPVGCQEGDLQAVKVAGSGALLSVAGECCTRA